MAQQDIRVTLAKILDIHQSVHTSSESTMHLCKVLNEKATHSKEVLINLLQLEDELVAQANDLVAAANLCGQAQRWVSMDVYELTTPSMDHKKSTKKIKAEKMDDMPSTINPQDIAYDTRPTKKARKSLNIKLPAQPITENDLLSMLASSTEINNA